MRSKWLVALLAAALVLSLMAGCAKKQPAEAPKPPPEKILVFARGSDSVSLDPAMIVDGESAKVCNNIYDNLVRYKADSTEVEPALAESWESPDGIVWTFHLRKNVKFHDGTPFNAQAVKFNIDRQAPDVRVPDMAYADFTLGMIDKVEVIDDYTIRFTLKYPYAPFLLNLAMGLSAPICSPTAIQKYGADYGMHPVGTGPFIFERWDKEQQIVLKANPEWWGGKPKVDKLVFKVTKENAVRANELLAGEIDMMDGVDPNDVQRIQADPNVKLIQAPGMNINYMGFRVFKPPFNNQKVRQAVSMAIDRKTLVEHLYQGNSLLANGPLPPCLWGYVPELKPYDYDPEGAKALLAEAGYPNGFTMDLLCYPNPRGYNPVGGERLGEAIQADLAKVGIKVNLVSKAWKEHLAACAGTDGHAYLIGWMGDNGDPDNFLYILLHGSQSEGMNYSHYANPQVDDLLTKAQQTSNADERLALYKQAQEIIVRDAPWVFISHAMDMVAMRKNVTGFKIHPTSSIFLWNVDK
ncbi:MAG: ABC transporter substrate-binding protein [Acetobacteraceae bacterium]|nr:ABC transporter substrate-binding protein [Acetobacteraceae bacterium]